MRGGPVMSAGWLMDQFVLEIETYEATFAKRGAQAGEQGDRAKAS